MAFVQSLGSLNLVQPTWQPGIFRSTIRMYDQYNYDYATMYRTQPNVRTCVDFLARNIAQLGLHVFRRISDTDRERLTDHPLAKIIKNPLPPKYKLTEYRFKEAIMGDLGIYFNAYVLKIRQDKQMGLLRIPPIYVTPRGNLTPDYYEITVGGLYKEIPADDMIHFWGYNPENAISGLSPSETLRRILAEEYSAGQWREGFWQNKARMEGIIKRPAGAPEWSDQARERFKSEFAELYAGRDNSGKTAILEEGMEWEQMTFNARESEYLAGRKLTREECARAYHIPLPLVGILDHATFSNITEQHKHLYQDTLGPWLTSIEQDIELQLLPEFDDTKKVYVEFNIAEKLQGSFEEQTKAFQAAVGRPWMTADEARAKMNLPSLGGDAELLVTPLNVIVGGQASPQDSVPPEKGQKARRGFNSHSPQMRARYQQKWIQVLSKHYRRQEAAIIGHIPKSAKGDIGGVWWDGERWNRELQEDLLKLNLLTAKAWADRLAEFYDSEVSDEIMMPYLQEHSRIQSENINNFTRDKISAALQEPEPHQAVKDIFTEAESTWAMREAITAVTAMSSFGTHEGARSARLTRKTWWVNSANPRDSHAALNGYSVGIRENFPNGLRWPGDSSAADANEVANCQCSVEFS
jgi:HK97 family phage portal protein